VLLFVVAFSMLPGTASWAQGQATTPSAVTPWIELELSAIASHRLNPPRASRALAHVSRAMYLAARAAAPPARDDAVAGAASIVLSYVFPDEAVRIDALTGELADRDSSAFRRGNVIATAARRARRARWCGHRLDRNSA
jgi:hypothetical protein